MKKKTDLGLGPSGDAFAVLPSVPSDQEGDWWVDLQEIDLDPPLDPTDEDLLLRLDLMGELQWIYFRNRLLRQRCFGLGWLAYRALHLNYLLTRWRFNRRLERLGIRRIPKSFLSAWD